MRKFNGKQFKPADKRGSFSTKIFSWRNFVSQKWEKNTEWNGKCEAFKNE